MTEANKVEVRGDKLRISEEVIATIAGIAASDVEGVALLSGGLADGIAGMLGKKNLSKGVKVEAGEKEAAIDVSVIVEYGCKIHMVAKDVQNKVREAVEGMTGLKVVEVSVNVVGVNVPKEFKKEGAETGAQGAE